MGNATTWKDPDSVYANQGQLNPGVFYLIDPATGHAVAPGSVSTITNDGSFIAKGDPVSNDGTFFREATHNQAVTAGATSDTVIKNSSGFLFRLLVTATGSGNTLIYDNASGHTGTVIGIIKSSAAVGDIVEARGYAANGITVAGNAANAGFTAFYS